MRSAKSSAFSRSAFAISRRYGARSPWSLPRHSRNAAWQVSTTSNAASALIRSYVAIASSVAGLVVVIRVIFNSPNWFESPRVCLRLHRLRGWSREDDSEMNPGGAEEGPSYGDAIILSIRARGVGASFLMDDRSRGPGGNLSRDEGSRTSPSVRTIRVAHASVPRRGIIGHRRYRLFTPPGSVPESMDIAVGAACRRALQSCRPGARPAGSAGDS